MMGKHDMHISLFHKEKWCLDKKKVCRTLAIEMNENGVCTIPYLQWLLSHFNHLGSCSILKIIKVRTLSR